MSKEPPRTMSIGISIIQLPPEVLTKIFQNPELPDRKSIRLSCKLFYDACKQLPIINQEKFVFRRGYSVEEIYKTLLSCKYLRLNLEFQELALHLFPKKMWTHCGDKIYSLTFYQSSLNDEVLKNIIIHCRNMKHWNLGVHSSDWFFRSLCGVESLKPFEELVKQEIIRQQLETFEVLIKDEHGSMWVSIIKQIFAIFPKMTTFKVVSRNSDEFLRSYNSITVPPKLALSHFDKFLVSMNIERLLFDIPSDGHWLKNSSVCNLRLKEIQTSLYHSDRILQTLLDFLSHQKLLEVICLRMCNISKKLVKKLLFHIIEVCPNLRHLQLCYQTRDIIELNVHEFSLLLQKRFEFLDLRFVVNDSQPDKMIQLPVNRNLHTLILCQDPPGNGHGYVLILEYFQNLKHLDICCTDEILQAIFKNQPNLEILRLCGLRHCTDFGLTGRWGYVEPTLPVYSISRLKNLRCLDIDPWCSGFTENALLELVFPKLKHFCFDVTSVDSSIVENFVKIAEHCPMLEIVNVAVELNFSQLLDFCCKLKKLYFINCTWAEILPSDPVKLIRACPSLRYVQTEDETFCFNPFTKKISVQEGWDFDPHSECSIHRLWSHYLV